MSNKQILMTALAAFLATGFPSNDASTFSSDRISVVTHGQGPDIVFIPGLASHSDVFASTAQAVKSRYRSHLVQVNGFAGTNARGNATGPVMAGVAEEVARYIATKRLKHPVIIGHSMGGSIAMMIAARHPDVVGGLMVIDMIPFAGAYFVAPDATSETARPRAEQIATTVLRTPPGEVAPELLDMFSGMTRNDAARGRILDWLRASDRRVVAQSFREVITTDLRPELSRITCPVTVLYVLPPGQATHPLMGSAYANLPQARLIQVDNAKHFIMFDQPQRMTAEIDAFIHALKW